MLRAFAGIALWAAAGSLAAAVATAEIYRWKDGSGEHFTTELGSVPSAHRAAAKSAVEKASGATVNRFPAAAPAAPGAPPELTSDRAPAAKANEGEKVGGYDEAHWRDRVQTQQSEIQQLEESVERCKKIEAPVRYNVRTGRAMKQQHYDRRMAAVDRCANDQSNLGVKRRQLENFLESARRKGVPPGWLR